MKPKSTNFAFLDNLPFSANPIAAITAPSIQGVSINFKLWGWSLLSFFPCLLNLTHKSHFPSSPSSPYSLQQRKGRSFTGCSVPLFRPYVANVPWHRGARAFLSQFFPRYGHYCGPNWSSGKDGGSLLWDQRPIDWLDFCCYCHDIGYDTHDQASLLKADMAFLECLERPRMSDKGDARIAHAYRTMCITGLRNILIPYRRHLVKLRGGQSLMPWLGSSNGNSDE